MKSFSFLNGSKVVFMFLFLPNYRHDFQFFNTQRLTELYEKEVRHLMVSGHLLLRVEVAPL